MFRHIDDIKRRLQTVSYRPPIGVSAATSLFYIPFHLTRWSSFCPPCSTSDRSGNHPRIKLAQGTG
jgi:hypothetical protein